MRILSIVDVNSISPSLAYRNVENYFDCRQISLEVDCTEIESYLNHIGHLTHNPGNYECALQGKISYTESDRKTEDRQH